MPYFMKNLADHIQSDHVLPVRGFSYSFNLPYKIDMVFIDGDHRYETVVKDIKKAYELLKSGGLICGHDYNHPQWPGVKKAVDELVGPVGVEHTIWHAIKS
jgi:predicted O-methyltransferase YrrM